jgi:hypothetical protein
MAGTPRSIVLGESKIRCMNRSRQIGSSGSHRNNNIIFKKWLYNRTLKVFNISWAG